MVTCQRSSVPVVKDYVANYTLSLSEINWKSSLLISLVQRLLVDVAKLLDPLTQLKGTCKPGPRHSSWCVELSTPLIVLVGTLIDAFIGRYTY